MWRSGRDRAMPWSKRRVKASSEGALRRNLSRAGVLKKRSCASTAVPGSVATSSLASMTPPAPRSRVPDRASAGAGAYLESAHRADGGQASPRKPRVRDGVEIGLVGDLRGRVALEREVEVVAGHPRPVVGHADELAPRVLQLHGDGARAGVDGVFHQLLDHGGRALDDLARGDLVDELLGEATDRGSCWAFRALLPLREQVERLQRRQRRRRRAAASSLRRGSVRGGKSPSWAAAGASARSDGSDRRGRALSSSARISRARADHRRGQSGETGDLDAVRAIRPSGTDLVEKDDLVVPLLHGHVEVAHAGQRLGERGQLVVVGGEQHLGSAAAVVELLGHRPRDGEAVEGGGAAARPRRAG